MLIPCITLDLAGAPWIGRVVRIPFASCQPWYNRPVFDPSGRDHHVESFFFKANDPQRRRALWTKLTLFANGKESYGETWAILFDADSGRHRAAKNRWGLEEVNIDPARGGVAIGSCIAEEGAGTAHTRGLVTADDFSLSWDLRLDDELGPYRHLPADWLYRSRITGYKLLSPHPCAAVSGRVEIWPGPAEGSERQMIAVDGWRGMQGHNWGRRHTERYAWSHCNLFEERAQAGEASFFEGFWARARIAGLPRAVSMGRLVIRGRAYRFDTWRNLRGGRGEVTPTSWRFALDGPDGRLCGVVEGRPDDTVGLVYANPIGPPAHCLNTKIAELTLTLNPRQGEPITLHSDKAALEVTQLDTDHGIEIVL